ncbi:MAG TPA: RsmD family RNA methyltransferase, partial [Jatrophihabitantaceae bacterium]|nr:RsmD family RNA methyltransferase [Jatrophihabitantaceae bacterium]
MTRIVSGVARGRHLAVPAKGTRPTSERAREALFNTLLGMLELEGARVLDLFAGTGAVGL